MFYRLTAYTCLTIMLACPKAALCDADAIEKETITSKLHKSFVQNAYDQYVLDLAEVKDNGLLTALRQKDVVEALVAVKKSRIPIAERSKIITRLTALFPYALSIWKCLSSDPAFLTSGELPPSISYQDINYIKRTLKGMGEQEAAQFMGLAALPFGYKIGIYNSDVSDVSVILDFTPITAQQFLNRIRQAGGNQAMRNVSSALVTVGYPVSKKKTSEEQRLKVRTLVRLLLPGELNGDVEQAEDLLAMGQKEAGEELVHLISESYKLDIIVQAKCYSVIRNYLGQSAAQNLLKRMETYIPPEKMVELIKVLS